MTEQRSAEWFEKRKGRITGSRIGAILGLSPWQTPEDVLRSMVREYHGAPSEFEGNPATQHGINNEQRALLAFMRETGLQVESCGFFPYGDRLGASPDGITSDDAVLELKVPFGLRNGGQFKKLAQQPHYAAQVQMEILAAGKTHAYFAQYIAPKGDPLSIDYVEEQIEIEHVELVQDWWDRVHPQLDAFYQRYLAELDNPEHLEPKRKQIDDPEAAAMIAIIDNLRAQKKEIEEEEKKLLARLVKIAGEQNADIMGRKLTRTKDSVSVSYAKALAAIAPEADLTPYQTTKKGYWKLT